MIWQAVGAGLILISVALMWASRRGRRRRLSWAALGLLAATGLIDLVLIAFGQTTISAWVGGVVPGWARYPALIFLLGHTWLVFGVKGFLPVLLGVVWGHLLW